MVWSIRGKTDFCAFDPGASSLGAPGIAVWSEIWDIIAPLMTQVHKERRGSTNNKALRLDLNREGYEEECYFDFTFSPIFMQDGSVGGVLALVQEVTQSILNQRRLSTLNQFSKQAPLIQSITGAYSMITSILRESNNPDTPFSIVYKTEEILKEPQLSHGTFSSNPSKATCNSPSTASPANAISGATFSALESATGGNPSKHEDFLSLGTHAGIPLFSGELDQEGLDFALGSSDSKISAAVRTKVRLIRSHFFTGISPGKKEARRVPQMATLCSTSFDRNLEAASYSGTTERTFSKATSTRHIPDSLLITPEEYEPLDPSDPIYDDPWTWPVRSVLADGIPRLVTLPKSTHNLARALLLPILENPSVLESRITTILIVGINPFQMLDDQYLDFLALLVANIASLLHFARAREEERKSAQALFELNKAKISFFQNISHELRTPLTLMLGPLDDALGQTAENTSIRQNLEMVRRNSRRLLKLVNMLLQFSRIEAGKGHAIFEETDLTKATREVSANFESVARGFGLQYNINCESLDDIPGGFWVDQAMWSGVLLNLIGNAFKHTWEGSVTVHQYPCKDKNGRNGVAVDVIDTGVGIAAEYLPTLFDRFNRIENKQSRSHEGTGIGLSLVKELAEVHGGAVSVTSELEKGSCFHLWIPAGREHHPCSQVKLGDSMEIEDPPKLAKDGAINNKTDSSMYIEEATQWIAYKALPGSTLTTSGTDSTEEEKPEDDDDDMVHTGADYMRDRQDSIEINTEYEVSTLNMEETELTKILIDSPVCGDVTVPENTLTKISTQIAPRQSSFSAQNPKAPVTEILSKDDSEANPQINASGNDGSVYGIQDQMDRLEQEPGDNMCMLPKVRSRRGYIIIVDDNNDMRSYLREILGKEFRVRCAVDGLDAIRLISERLQQGKRIDLVLSDVAMPNMNGYELLKRLRSDSATMLTPFILLSARAGEEANVEGLDLGADDCLVKPFSTRELLARVRSTIRLSDLRHELIREQRHALEMKQLIYSVSVRIRSGLSLPQILDTASKELFKVIRCNAIRICRFRKVDQETGQHWIRAVSEVVRVGKPKMSTSIDHLLPKGLEVQETHVIGSDHDMASEMRHVTLQQHPIFGSKSFISVALIYNRRIWGYLLASRDADMVVWTQSEKLLFEQTGNQISMAIAHASLWEMKKSQQVEMEAAHAANEAKSQILANTSHELRTPIGAIVGALSALEDTDGNLTGEQRDMIKIMQITSDVALSVINDLLDTAKLEAGAMSLSIKECPGLLEIIEQSVRIFADKAGRKEVDLIMEPSDDLEWLEELLQQDNNVIWTDEDRLQQVIMNVIGNAVKFTAAGKVLARCSLIKDDASEDDDQAKEQSRLRQKDDHQPQQERNHQQQLFNVPLPPDAQVTNATLRFEVEDTGIGIDPDFLKNHIFKSFAQYDQSMTRRFGGTGLGLAISKHLVMMNGGILGVTSNVGQGSTFYFTWPILIVNSPSSTATAKTPYLQRGPSVRLMLAPEIASETRVVVVESVPESRHLLGTILNQQNVQVKLYESYDHVVQDERERPRDLLGSDGVILAPNYRPNAHFFFCTRPANAEATIETARQLGLLFKQRNDTAKAEAQLGGRYKDLVLSIVLIVFSSPQGRYLAKDMMKRICAGGLEQTIQCRYIVKPVKADRVVECLQMLGSHAPYIRDITNPSPDAFNTGTIQDKQSALTQNPPHELPEQPTDHHSCLEINCNDANISPTVNYPESRIISVDEDVSLVSSDYERDNDCNKNTPESAPAICDRDVDASMRRPSLSANLGSSGNIDSEHPIPTARVHEAAAANGILPSGQHHPPMRSPALAIQRRLRMKAAAESLAGNSNVNGASLVKKPGTAKDDSVKSLSNDPAFSSRAARAAAGKRERKGKCVLCVEDNIINLRVVQYQLQKLGYDTQSACDGQVAVDIIKAQVEMLNQTSSPTSSSTLLDVAAGEENSDSSSHPGIRASSAADKAPVSVNSDTSASQAMVSTSLSALSIPANVSSASSISSASSSQSTVPLETIAATTKASASPSVELMNNVAAAADLLPDNSSPNVPAKQAKIDLILMDCAMPVKSGFDAASEIRSMGLSSTFAASIPIIALTASAVPSTKEKCLASGMNGYLSKPTKLADLEAMLDQWIA
ncbi:hypothetical protein BX616_002399 [Lobosporangium transversale]|nr:hypothetical protein BX616_002399 [Lobosporangium transversale]